MSAVGDAPLVWDPPGKGDWRGLHDHFPRALTPQYQLLLAGGMISGEAEHFAHYGMPARTMQPAFVHGRVFITAAPLVGPMSNRIPPAPLLWLAVRTVPAFRRRTAAARDALTNRRWLAEAARWYQVDRERWQQANTELESVDPGQLATPELIAHLEVVHEHAQHGYREHFRLHGADLLPTAMFLARAADWGIDWTDGSALLAGSSPASRGAAPLPDWCLVTGYDLDELAACELPSHNRTPERAGARPAPPTPDDTELRARVPADHRAEWDIRLEDARATYGLRDDNGLLTAAWPVGLLRRAMLASGRQLMTRGRLSQATDAIEFTVAELVAALRGESGVLSAEEARARRQERQRLSAHAPPAALGPTLDLPVRALPRPMRLVVQALLTVRDLGMTPAGDRHALVGVGVSGSRVVGRACVAVEPSEALTRFEPGDIIVTAGTCPAWNMLLAEAGGVVTEEGGPLSHAAIIARELGIAAVVGAAHAVTQIPDGARVEVDPERGSVRVLDSAGP